MTELFSLLMGLFVLLALLQIAHQLYELTASINRMIDFHVDNYRDHINELELELADARTKRNE